VADGVGEGLADGHVASSAGGDMVCDLAEHRELAERQRTMAKAFRRFTLQWNDSAVGDTTEIQPIDEIIERSPAPTRRSSRAYGCRAIMRLAQILTAYLVGGLI
jgi:hypothetical protein